MPDAFDTVKPSADDAAKAILAAAMAREDLAERVVESLHSEDFRSSADWGDLWAVVFDAVKALVDKGKRPVAFLIDQEIKRAGNAPEYYKLEHLKLLASEYSPGVPINEYIATLKEYGYRRSLWNAGTAMREASKNQTLGMTDLTSRAQEAWDSADGMVTLTNEPKRMGDVIAERLKHHKSRRAGEFEGIRTGFKDIDRILLGLCPADYIIIAARPSVGKTTLAECMADNMSKAGLVPFFASCEQQVEQLADRAIAAEGGVNGRELRAGLVSADRWEGTEKRLQRLSEANYFLDDTCRTVPQIRRAALRVKRKVGRLDIIFVDYLQMLDCHVRKENRVQEITFISKSLKQLAKELGVPVVVLSQLSRAVETRQQNDQRPQLSDLRESGAIEQDADMVGFLYRQNYQQTENQPAEVDTEFIIRKNRNGSLGTAVLGFIAECTKYVSKNG